MKTGKSGLAAMAAGCVIATYSALTHADVVMLVNGDRLTGTIVRKETEK